MALPTVSMQTASFEIPDKLAMVRNALNAIWTKRTYSLHFAADALAADNTAETEIPREQVAGTISGVDITGEGAGLTANNTDFATITIAKRTVALPGTAVTICTLVTNVAGGSWTQWVAKAFASLDATAKVLLAGDKVTYKIVKSGAGVVVPAGNIKLTFEPTLPTS